MSEKIAVIAGLHVSYLCLLMRRTLPTETLESSLAQLYVLPVLNTSQRNITTLLLEQSTLQIPFRSSQI